MNQTSYSPITRARSNKMSKTLENISDAFILPKGIRERYLVPRNRPDDPLRSAGIQFATLSEVHPPYQIMKNNPPYHHIIYSIAGKARYKTEIDQGVFQSGYFWVTPANIHHFIRAEDEWNFLGFIIEDNAMWRFLHEWPGGQRYSVWMSRLLETMEGYVAEAMRSEDDAKKALHSYANLIGIYLLRDIKREEDLKSKNTFNKVDKLWQEVNSKLQHPWTVKDLAETIHVSSSHLHRLVASQNKSSPLGMVTHLRMKRAKELLLHTNYPIKLISELTGYQTPYSFSKAFKRNIGVSPGTLRQNRP